MSDPYAAHETDLTRLHRFILEHFDREDLRTLSFDLGVDYDNLPAEGKTAKARELILALGHRHQLGRLLSGLWQARPGPFAQVGLSSDSRTIASLEAQLSALEQAPVAHRQDQRPSISPLASTYVEPGRPKRRRVVAVVVILTVIVSLVLSILTQPWGSQEPGVATAPLNSFLWIVQIIVSFIAILASVVQLSGLGVRELFSARSAGASTEVFPFHIIHDFDELLGYIFPDPTTPLLPDHSVPFHPRIADELDTAFHQRGRVLISGRSKTGKTREAVELLRRWWYSGPTVLLAKNHVGLYPPYRVPDTLPVRNLVLFFDDIDRYCGDADAVERLDQTIAFFADLCRDPGELRVIVTARQEPEFWDKLHYDEAAPPWTTFRTLSLPALSSDGARRLIDHLAQDCGMDVDPAAAEDMAIKNDGTFLNLVLPFRSWLHEGIKQIGSEQAAAFEGNLVTTWRHRYERLVEVLPEAGPIYAAADLLQTLGVPLRPVFITDLATEMNLGRSYHLTCGLFHWISQKLTLSPRLDWYRNPRRRRRGVALGVLVALLTLYTLLYILFCITPASFQIDFFSKLADELWLQLLFVSPLLIPLAPLALSLVLRQHHRREHRHIRSALDRLLTTEIPLRGDELRPYEGQFEGNGTSRAWRPTLFAGQGSTAASRRLAAPRLAAMYWTWAEELRATGELGPAHSLARLASVLAPEHPTPPFVLGKLRHDAGDFRRALAEFARCRALNPTASAALALERIAWCFYHLEEYERAESAAGQALTLMPSLSAARWAQGLAQLQQGQGKAGLGNCRQAALVEEAPPSNLGPALGTALAGEKSRGWAIQVSRLLRRDPSLKTKHSVLWRRVKWVIALGLILVSVLVFLLGVPSLIRKTDEDASFGIQMMSFLLRLYPNAPAVLAQRGWDYLKLGDYKQAVADYTEAIRLDPEHTWAYYERGTVYYSLGDYERAIADYTEAIRLDSEYPWAHYNRGNAYYSLGDYERAIADCTEAIRLDPDYARTYVVRGNAYRELGDYEQAIADYTEAIRLDPDYTWAYDNLESICQESNDYGQLIAIYDKAIELNPETVYPYFRRGRVYQQLGNYEKAIADYTEAIRLDPDYTDAYARRGYAYQKLGDYEKAIAEYTEAIRINPDYAPAYYYLESICQELNDYGQLIAIYDKAIELNPETVYPYFRRGRVYQQLGNYEKAIADYTEAIRITPSYVWVYNSRGIVYYDAGEYEKAIADYTEAVRLYPNYIDAYENRGHAYRAQGNLTAARADWEHAIELYEAQGRSDSAERVRSLLSSLGD